MTKPPSDAAVRAWTRLVRAQLAAMAAVEARLKQAGLPPLAWYDVLLAVERAGAPGLRPFALEQAMLLEQYNLSRLVGRLAAKGYVERRRCPADKRGQYLVITRAGLALRKKMWRVYGPAIRDAVGARLSDREAATLAALLERLAAPALADPALDAPIDTALARDIGRGDIASRLAIPAHAAMAAGGDVVGALPEALIRDERAERAITELILDDTLNARKTMMSQFADCFAALPGGLGTLDEIVTEMLKVDLGQTDKPVYLVDIDGYWQRFLRPIEHFDANRMLRPRARTGLMIVPSVDAFFAAIAPEFKPALAPAWRSLRLMLSSMIARKVLAMGQLLVRNLDDAVIERLKRQAEARRISLEQLLRELLSEAAGPTRQALVAEMDRIRAMTPKKLTTDSADIIRDARDRR